MIIVGGRNVFPEDVERAAPSAVDGVRPGNVIAFSIVSDRGKERLVVVAETKADDLGPIRADVARRVRESVGLPTDEVVLVGPGTLPKTSSGKLQRSLCRTRYLDEELVRRLAAGLGLQVGDDAGPDVGVARRRARRSEAVEEVAVALEQAAATPSGSATTANVSAPRRRSASPISFHWPCLRHRVQLGCRSSQPCRSSTAAYAGVEP